MLFRSNTFNFKLSDKGIAHFTALAEKHGVGFYLRPERPADLNVPLEVDPSTGYASLKCLDIQDGSTIVFDEAQEYFKSRGMSKEPTPPFVAMLPTHRHSGYNIHFITQNVMYLDIEIRRICDNYTKYSRLMNWSQCRLDIYGGVKDNPMHQNQVLLERGQTFRYPKHIFELYTSSVDHNMKSRFPTRLKWLIVLIVIIVILFYVAYYSWSSMMGGITKSASSGSKSPIVPPSSGAAPAALPHSGNKVPPSSSPGSGVTPSNRHTDLVPGSMDSGVVPLGKNRPSIYGLEGYILTYSGHMQLVDGKDYLVLSMQRLDGDGSCSYATHELLKALGLSTYYGDRFLVIYNTQERIRYVLPMSPSPCVTTYHASNDFQSPSSSSSASSELIKPSSSGSSNSRPYQPANRVGSNTSGGFGSGSSYSYPSNPDSTR